MCANRGEVLAAQHVSVAHIAKSVVRHVRRYICKVLLGRVMGSDGHCV
jgi:hypothetical protein